MSIGTSDDTIELLKTAEQAFAWTEPDRIGVAVSGGSDSIAALHLIVKASAKLGWRVAAMTVDHRLRQEAADEAVFVGNVCNALGVPHQTLVWSHGDITGNLMDAARRARYDLISRWAVQNGVKHVVLGHTADDQAETFLMGLSRAAGLDGLSGMRRAWTQNDIVFVRPFLDISRARLQGYLQEQGLHWIDDPTNDDDKFTRIKARKVLAALQPLGITSDQLARVADNLAMAQSVVRVAASEAARRVVQECGGELVIDRAAFHALQLELQRRILIGTFAWMSGAIHPPRADAIDRVARAILAGKHATLSGCRIGVTDTTIRVLREPKAVATIVTPTTAVWDNRWHLDGPHAPDLTIRALGDGLRQIANWRETGLPRDALIVTPAIWREDALIAAPLAGFAEGWTATLRPGFGSFLLSH